MIVWLKLHVTLVLLFVVFLLSIVPIPFYAVLSIITFYHFINTNVTEI